MIPICVPVALHALPWRTTTLASGEIRDRSYLVRLTPALALRRPPPRPRRRTVDSDDIEERAADVSSLLLLSSPAEELSIAAAADAADASSGGGRPFTYTKILGRWPQKCTIGH